jgi:hypothetical protein
MIKIMAYGVANLAKIKNDNHVFSFQSSTDALENGFIVFKGGLVSGEKEIYTAVKPLTASLNTESVYLIKAPEINYDESSYSKKQLGQFRTEANVPTRGYEIGKNDIIEISYDALTLLGADATVGNFLIAQNNSYKLAESASDAGTAKFSAKILEIKTIGTLQYVGGNGQVGNQYKMVVAEVIRN